MLENNSRISEFFSDDQNRTASIVMHDGLLKVIFVDGISNINAFKYYKSSNSAEAAAENFVMYESY